MCSSVHKRKTVDNDVWLNHQNRIYDIVIDAMNKSLENPPKESYQFNYTLDEKWVDGNSVEVYREVGETSDVFVTFGEQFIASSYPDKYEGYEDVTFLERESND